MVSLLVL